ncbi:ribonuclease J [Parasphingorhabdus marina DSM 22363]|uniref:Ribonuclease J n=1 Tax=Parasphingorhabdus marina DSM 22363 TaxID=1123272 RepID=A0A1N6G0A7_9SPHN|nr:ribonuclease J [Parasphingorhabdus marina]SIO00953.1 ribonuclease J [Parasphingorhabdus marina DSM 22363]
MTKSDSELLFLALGGSAEIGMNVNLYGCDGKWVMVDLGMTFADPGYPGIDLVLPDLEFIEKRSDDLLGIVLTHGHEDHIGAIPYLAGDLDVPLYATPFTAGLIRRKLEEAGLEHDVELNIIPNEGSFELGPFGFRYLPIAHSIAEGNALLISTPHGNIFHTGDWKLDDEPLLGIPATPEELTAVGDEGVLAMICDSTNVFNNDPSGSEGDVFRNLARVVEEIDTRVLITTFASNAARLQTLGEVAKATGRTLCVAGRSLDRIIENSRETGYLKDFPPVVDFEEAMNLPRDKVMIVATGGQGETRAALGRIAGDSHKIKLTAGDHVLFSSKQIPGNEIAIGRIQNQLAAKDVVMITDRQEHIHVSGHPGRPELAKMYDWIRPDILVPVHGEIRHMKEQARFGRAHGIAHTVFQQNGDIVRLAPGKPEVIGQERTGRLVLDGDVMIPADGRTLNERRKIGYNGLISVAVALDGDGKLAGDPVLRLAGVPLEQDEEEFLDEIGEDIQSKFVKPVGDLERFSEELRLLVRRSATEWTGKKPVVKVLVVET